MTPEECAELESILGHHFERPERLECALTHRSHRQDSGGEDNERLEFLGDRVLGLVASDRLCHAFPGWDAGKLSKGLARLVRASSIHSAAERLNLGRHLRLGPGEEKTGGRAEKETARRRVRSGRGRDLSRRGPPGGGRLLAAHPP